MIKVNKEDIFEEGNISFVFRNDIGIEKPVHEILFYIPYAYSKDKKFDYFVYQKRDESLDDDHYILAEARFTSDMKYIIFEEDNNYHLTKEDINKMIKMMYKENLGTGLTWEDFVEEYKSIWQDNPEKLSKISDTPFDFYKLLEDK